MPTSRPEDLPPAVGGPFRPVPPGNATTVWSLLSMRAIVPYMAVRFDRLYWYVAFRLSTVVLGSPDPLHVLRSYPTRTSDCPNGNTAPISPRVSWLFGKFSRS